MFSRWSAAQTKAQAIRRLHFHPKWFEYALLPNKFFQEQLQLYRHSRKEENWIWQALEHHRYQAFCTILQEYEVLSDEQLHNYIHLCQLDEDEGMARSALIDLLSWPGLTSSQYEALSAHREFAQPTIQKIIWRQQMSARLQEEVVSDQTLSEIIEKQDSVFERELVACDNLSRTQLETLAERGGSRAVRNIAKEKLKRRQS